jgi:hypothetical protein
VTAFVDKARSFSSTHSVDPIMPDSSAPQLQNLMVRLGRQPSKEEGMFIGDDGGCGDDDEYDGGGDDGDDDDGWIVMMIMVVMTVMVMGDGDDDCCSGDDD